MKCKEKIISFLKIKSATEQTFTSSDIQKLSYVYGGYSPETYGRIFRTIKRTSTDFIIKDISEQFPKKRETTYQVERTL